MKVQGEERAARVLVVDDHPVFRRGLVTLLDGEPWVAYVTEVATAGEAVRTAVADQIDLIAMDIRLPDGDGIEATYRIKKARPGAVVLLLTMVDDEKLMARGLSSGASGYVLKESDPDVVLDALRSVLAGNTVLGKRVATALVGMLRTEPVDLPAPFDRLTPRERDVLAQVAAGRSNRQAAKALSLAEKTVRNITSAVLAKLEVGSRLEAALLAKEVGIVAGLGEL